MTKISDKGTVVPIEKAKNPAEELQKVLNAQIEKALKLQKLISDRDIFIKKKTALVNFASAMKEEDPDELKNLETSVCKITLFDGRRYKDDAVLTISNRVIIEKFIHFVSAEMNKS